MGSGCFRRQRAETRSTVSMAQFVPDSPLEEGGFELPVPLATGSLL